ncbi:MAG: DNA polymerase Y family protein [Hyphomicrobiales bacterium]
MDATILHVAIDSFAVQAERLRCPKLVGRPLALVPQDSPRPRVVVASREARAAGVTPGTPLVVARRLCRDLIALPPDPDLYAGLSDSIRARLAPVAPFADGGGAGAGAAAAGAGASGSASPRPRPGRFVLDLTGVARTHDDACDRAARAGRDVEGAFGLHPTLGVAATRLVSGIAAHVLAPDGELLEVRPGNEAAFLAPLEARVLPASRGAAVAGRLDLLNVRLVRDVQALDVAAMEAAFGRAAALALWREARGRDGAPVRAAEAPPGAIAEETLSSETNDRRVLVARMERLVMEVGTGLRARGATARRLAVVVTYADGRGDRARATPPEPLTRDRELRDAATALLDRALRRRVRVRRLRLEAWEADLRAATQLTLWDATPGTSACDAMVEAEEERAGRLRGGAKRSRGTAPGALLPSPPMAGSRADESGAACRADESGAGSRADALDAALHGVRLRFGTDVLVPASWMALGVVRPSPRP